MISYAGEKRSVHRLQIRITFNIGFEDICPTYGRKRHVGVGYMGSTALNISLTYAGYPMWGEVNKWRLQVSL